MARRYLGMFMASTLLAGAAVACAEAEASGAEAPPVPAAPAAGPAGISGRTLLLDFDSPADRGSRVLTAQSTGSALVSAWVVSAYGGEARSAAGLGSGGGLRFPAYTDSATPPTAVLVVGPSGTEDGLDPGDRPFTFGTAFRLDAVSGGSVADDGDNLVQRGGYLSAGQYKLQVDNGIPSCRVQGDDGAAYVEADHAVTPDTWYLATCRRTPGRLKLTLEQYAVRGTHETWGTPASTGHLSLSGAPLTVGGKVTGAGVPSASADQFNGAVDHVFLDID